MRKHDSLFNKACTFINSVPVGSSFTTKEYIAAIGKYEKSSWWKTMRCSNKHYRCHVYKGYLKRAGFVHQIKHGVWGVDRHVPSWFDCGHLLILLSYYKWDSHFRYNITSYKMMEKIDIIAQLDKDAHRAMELLESNKKEKTLPKLYEVNRKAYQTFISQCRFIDINKFETKNKLGAFIEDCKWPGVANDGDAPRFAIETNYGPIINHLIADGVITEKFDGYRYSYTVIKKRLDEIYKSNPNFYQDPIIYERNPDTGVIKSRKPS